VTLTSRLDDRKDQHAVAERIKGNRLIRIRLGVILFRISRRRRACRHAFHPWRETKRPAQWRIVETLPALLSPAVRNSGTHVPP